MRMSKSGMLMTLLAAVGVTALLTRWFRSQAPAQPVPLPKVRSAGPEAMQNPPRRWDEQEILLLRTAAELIGGSIQRWYDEDDLRRVEQERQALERKLLETQHTESLGVLAEGVAHDFNNSLAAILGHAELALLDIPAGSEAAGYLAADWDQPMPFDEIESQRDVFGDGRIVLLPLPGHTPGSMGALARLDRSGTFLLAGDTVSLRATLDTGTIPRNTWNADLLARSLAEVRHVESSGTTILCSHDAEQWAGLRKGADVYD